MPINDKLKDTLSIGELSKKIKVSVEAIRFYEKKGLIAKPKRTASGYRKFNTLTQKQLLFITQAKELGFTLIEIKDLLNLKFKNKNKCSLVKNKAQEKLLNIEEKIKTFQNFKSSLKKLVKDCSNNKVIDECPFLDNLEVRKDDND